MNKAKGILVAILAVLIIVGGGLVLAAWEPFMMQLETQRLRWEAQVYANQAEYEEAAADKLRASGELEEKKAIGEALVRSVRSATRVLTFWGFLQPFLPIAYFGIGFMSAYLSLAVAILACVAAGATIGTIKGNSKVAESKTDQV